MARSSAPPAKLAEIDWKGGNCLLISALLTELEKPENKKVFVGKVDKRDNTSGDSKAKVCRRIGQVILPDLYNINAKALGDRVKSKIDSLVTTYRKHVARLRKTGGGIDDPNRVDDPDTLGTLTIGPDGPDELTESEPRNIWEEIVHEFRFFPRLHQMYGTRPNVVPIAITTGVGPNGPRTQWIQCPDPVSDDLIDPALREDVFDIPDLPSSPLLSHSPPRQTRTFGDNHTNTISPSTPVPTLQSERENSSSRPPKPSSASRLKLESIKAAVAMVPKKRTLTDAVIEMSNQTMMYHREESRLKHIDVQRSQLFQEFQAGVWTVEEYRAKIRSLTQPEPPVSPPTKRRAVSVDWDDELPSSSQSI